MKEEKIDFVKAVHLGTKLGEFKAYLKSYQIEVKEWKNYYDDQYTIKGKEIYDLEKEYALKTLSEVIDTFMELFENYFYPQENDE
jgi:hypothetical protein